MEEGRGAQGAGKGAAKQDADGAPLLPTERKNKTEKKKRGRRASSKKRGAMRPNARAGVKGRV